MKKILPLLVIIGLITWRVVYIQMSTPELWSKVWTNYEQSQSIVVLIKDTFAVFSGKNIKSVAIPVSEMERVVYQWENDLGETQTSFQRPTGIKNVREIRLGDLEYKTEKSLTKEEIQRLKNQPVDN